MLAPDGKKFVWGHIREIHVVGNYKIVEYTDSLTFFHVYVNDKDMSIGSRTLDGALLLAISAARHTGNEVGNAARYAARVLGVPED